MLVENGNLAVECWDGG